MGDRSAFFYGTLMMPQILNRVCYGTLNPTSFQANLLTITPAILPDYTRRKVRYCDYPAVVPSPSPSSVRGTYVRGLTDGDIFRLDIFEGSQYERRKVKIRVLTQVGDATGKGNAEGEELEVETYVWIAEKTDLEDGEWDFAEFRKKKLTKWIGRNEEYIEVDEVVNAGSVDSKRERGVNGSSKPNQLHSAIVEEVMESAV